MAPRQASAERRQKPLGPAVAGGIVRKRKKDDNFEPETQFILRVPHQFADHVRTYAEATPEENEANGRRLTIQFDNQFRQSMVDVNGILLKGKVVDLPAVLESHKTVDKKTTYKTNDISQLVICEEMNAEEAAAVSTTSVGTSGDSATTMVHATQAVSSAVAVNNNSLQPQSKNYHWPHGITPPMRNVRKRRFRRTVFQRDAEVNVLERELRRIIQEDNEAASYSFRIVYDDADGQPRTQPGEQQLTDGLVGPDDADSTISGSMLTDSAPGAAGIAAVVRADNEDSNLSLGDSGSEEDLDDETKARLQALAEENIRRRNLERKVELEREVFGDDFMSSDEEDDD